LGLSYVLHMVTVRLCGRKPKAILVFGNELSTVLHSSSFTYCSSRCYMYWICDRQCACVSLL